MAEARGSGTWKKPLGILLAVVGILSCIVSFACGGTVVFVGRTYYNEPAPLLVVLFLTAVVVTLASPIVTAVGVVLLARSGV